MGPKAILLYTDGSKTDSGTTASAWLYVHATNCNTPIFQRSCQIEARGNIEDGEIHAIQEWLGRLNKMETKDKEILLCVDNQNDLRSLSGRPTGNREYIKECLKEARILQLNSRKITGKWTTSHQNIDGNDQADMLAKRGTRQNPCKWTRTTISWLQPRPYDNMISQCY